MTNYFRTPSHRLCGPKVRDLISDPTHACKTTLTSDQSDEHKPAARTPRDHCCLPPYRRIKLYQSPVASLGALNMEAPGDFSSSEEGLRPLLRSIEDSKPTDCSKSSRHLVGTYDLYQTWAMLLH